MLHRDHISQVEIYSDEWHRIRLGRLTSSRMSVICGEKEFSEGAMTYIYHKAGELITLQTTAEDDQIEDENTIWGLTHEPEAIRQFGLKMGIDFLAVQKLILNTDSHFSSTPDAIWIKGLCENQYEYNVRTVEVKCPRKYHKFIPFYQAKTPEAVKKLNKCYYWQVIDQMDNCGSAMGYFVVFHPLFPPGANLNIVEFNKMNLWSDFKLLQERKKSAVQKLDEIMATFRV